MGSNDLINKLISTSDYKPDSIIIHKKDYYNLMKKRFKKKYKISSIRIKSYVFR